MKLCQERFLRDFYVDGDEFFFECPYGFCGLKTDKLYNNEITYIIKLIEDQCDQKCLSKKNPWLQLKCDALAILGIKCK